MPITMYNEETDQNVKVYGFVSVKCCIYGVTYMPKEKKQCIFSPEDLKMQLVNAQYLRPLEI